MGVFLNARLRLKDGTALCLPGCRFEDGEAFSAGCAALTERSILLGLPDGALASYRCSDAALVSEYQHGGGGITAVFPNQDGTM